MADQKSNPTAIFRVEVPCNVWELILEASSELKIKPKLLLNQILIRIGYQVRTGSISFLGEEYVAAQKRLRARGGLGSLVGDQSIEIDLGLLHRSEKLKSGYVGVYASNKGFRADGRSPSGRGVVYLGTFETPELAAWARYVHHTKYNLAYGDLETRQQELLERIAKRRQEPKFNGLSDDDVIAELEDECRYTPNQRSIIEEIHEVGIKFGSIDGSKKVEHKAPTIDPAILAAVTAAVDGAE